MTLLELVDDFRLRTDDLGGDTGTVPVGFTYYWEYNDAGPLWKNREIVNYLNWAHREIAMRRPYRDSTTAAICTITVADGTTAYALDNRILSIEEVVLASTGKSLQKTTVRDLRQWAVGALNPTGIDAWKTTTGTPQYYCEDAEPGKITLVPVPLIDDALLLTVYRLPLEPFDWAYRTDDLDEPPSQLQETLVQGAMARAYQKRDADTYDPRHAAFHENQFNQMAGAPVDYATLEARRWNANLDTTIRSTPYVNTRRVGSWMDD
jgi:hypothetical protein